jgi:glycosyltransferase involved in cell wall biosynthesis
LAIQGATATLNEQLLRGDFFLCASDKQRDLWLGHLASLGRVNARTYDDDESLRRLIDVVPFGIDDEPPTRTGPGAKGVVPGIAHEDELVLWGGGIYNWFDPLSLIHAIDRLRRRRPTVRLLFMGGRHPNPEIPDMRMAVQARTLAADLGLRDSHVFFNDGWVPYEERQNFLLDADVAVSTHLDHVETAYSFRTRVLDYLWAGVPVVATSGDALAQLIESRRLGLTVPPRDPVAIETAMARLLDDRELAAACRANAAELAPELRWERVLEPLKTFCSAPRRAPDLGDPRLGPVLERARRSAGPPPSSGVRHDAGLVVEHLRAGGVRLLLRRVSARLRRIVVESRAPHA